MIIQFLDGAEYDIEQHGLKRLFHYIPSLTVERESVIVEGRSGSIPVSYRYGDRIIKTRILYKVADIYDFYLFRDEVNAKFAMREPFYVTFKREPYKRWFVSLAAPFEIEPNKQAGEFELEFVCENVFAEAIATTADIKEWDVDKWAWNGSINWDEDLQYTFTSTSFAVHNLGTQEIDPRENELKITIRGDFPNGFTMTNQTTGESFVYKGALSSTTALTVDGMRVLKGSISDFINAKDGDFISLKKGQNNIVINTNGGTLTSVAFDFRFLYK